MSDNRYKELKKENNIKASQLSSSYQKIANAYVAKARGYAVKALDTEARIKEVLDELTDFDSRGVNVAIAIPNMTDYIEEKIKHLARVNYNPSKIKSVVATSIFALVIIGFIIFGLYLRSGNVLDTPTNLQAIPHGNNIIVLTWDKVEYASAGYIVWYSYNGKTSDKVEAETNTCSFNLDPNKEYIFYVYAKDVVSGSGENVTYIYYASDIAELEYKPS